MVDSVYSVCSHKPSSGQHNRDEGQMARHGRTHRHRAIHRPNARAYIRRHSVASILPASAFGQDREERHVLVIHSRHWLLHCWSSADDHWRYC